jgi:hypothetical protein
MIAPSYNLAHLSVTILGLKFQDLEMQGWLDLTLEPTHMS